MQQLAPSSIWGRLEGNRIVHLVYMDEAGISRDEPHLVVSGVMVDADKKLVAVERHIEKLVNRYIPEDHRDGFVFHATELFNGGGKLFKRSDPNWPIERRLEIADELSKAIKKFALPLVFGHVEKKEFFPKLEAPPTWGAHDFTLAGHVVAFMSAAMQVEMWMRQNTNGEVCLLIIENTESARKLITETQTTYQSPAALRKLYQGEIPKEDAQYFPFRRIKQSPLFEPKAPSSVLQLADFAAYVFKKLLVGNKHYKRFVDVFMSSLAVKATDLPRGGPAN